MLSYHNATKLASQTVSLLITPLLVLFFSLLFTNFCFAESTINLKQVMQGESIALSTYYLEDPEKTYNIDQFQSAALLSRFQPLPHGKRVFT